MVPDLSPSGHSFSTEALQSLSERFLLRDTLQAELIYLLRQLRQSEQRALELPTPDGLLLSAILSDLDDRVSSRLSWLLNTEKHSPLLESAYAVTLSN